jgi:hypothetical protein
MHPGLQRKSHRICIGKSGELEQWNAKSVPHPGFLPEGFATQILGAKNVHIRFGKGSLAVKKIPNSL